MDAISVLTTPARPMYLAATLAAIDMEGGGAVPRVVVSDGRPLPITPAGWSVVATGPKPIGVRAAMRHTFDCLYAMGAARALYFEDDIRLARHAVTRMLAIDVPDDHAFVSFFDGEELPGARRAPVGIYSVGLAGPTRRGLMGAVALLLPRRTLKWIVERADDWTGPSDAADQAITWWLRDSPWKLRGIHVPSLVEHVGDVSTMGHRAGQRACWFEG